MSEERKNSSLEYIIIQAGGKGTRLKKLTTNKPKAIVSINNLPMIYHLFRKYPKSRYVIIGDYKKNVLESYLEAFPEVSTFVVGTDGKTGTCSGIQNALSIIPPDTSFMLIWSDLILNDEFNIPENCSDNYIGISGSFSCRWSYCNDKFFEEKSEENGVAGLFIFKDKSIIGDIPCEGEFVRWLQANNMIFKKLPLNGAAEYGLIETIKPNQNGKCRPFNSMTIQDDKIIKKGIDEQGKQLAIREKKWYNYVKQYNVPIPIIYSLDPLTIERIDGKNVFDYNYSDSIKNIILERIMDGLENIHGHDITQTDWFSIKKVYYEKTLSRISKVRNLIPFANQKYITINNKVCRNIFFILDEIKTRIFSLNCDHFCLIHGDCTFSNILLKNGKTPVFIDPRGYFGDCELIGDPNYDWAKLYYSLYGNYDQFNLGRFSLSIEQSQVKLAINSNGWESTEKTFISKLPAGTNIKTIRFIHALIWLSLTTYAWDDYDSICGAFYNGLYYLEDSL